MNRREHYRIGTARLAAEATGLSTGRARRFPLRVLDLSGGGARVLTDRPLAAQQLVRIHLPAGPGLTRFHATARVVRCNPAGDLWEAALAFTSLSEAERDLVVRRVFREELRRAARRARPAPGRV